ncbi:hypothetical protein E5A73_14820 [Sphingomonas gei]|uniref:Uncharacterized protein n=1 Tax=Sphingomonas gei TaxID=1395960 RepID=A0A4V3QZ54_9SPHN|nr:HEPN domain-containing protein [Sphingomonas gei]TGX52892.1 hypothetical protein E5A73_14820 [Sphingomonas gei]
MRAADASFSVQFWRHHFLNVDWLHQLEDAASHDLNGREILVREYLPESFLDKVSITVRPITDEESRLNGRSLASKTHRAVEFSLFGYDIGRLKDIYDSMDENYPLTFHEFSGYTITSELERFCHIVLFLASVCYASAVHYDLPICRFNDDDFGTSSFEILSIHRTPDAFDFLSAPITSPVNLDTILLWSKKCSGIWSGSARTRVEKAMSFFSHTTSPSSGGNDVTRLIWATAALEALVCDNNNSISNQLKKRLPLLSSEIKFTNLNKQIRNAYGFRSRLLHGDLPVPNAFLDGSDSSFESDEVWIHGHFLQILLISCLWTAVIHDAIDFDFNEQLRLG